MHLLMRDLVHLDLTTTQFGIKSDKRSWIMDTREFRDDSTFHSKALKSISGAERKSKARMRSEPNCAIYCSVAARERQRAFPNALQG